MQGLQVRHNQVPKVFRTMRNGSGGDPPGPWMGLARWVDQKLEKHMCGVRNRACVLFSHPEAASSFEEIQLAGQRSDLISSARRTGGSEPAAGFSLGHSRRLPSSQEGSKGGRGCSWVQWQHVVRVHTACSCAGSGHLLTCSS